MSSKAAERRYAWLRDVMEPINEHARAGSQPSLTDYMRAYMRIRDEGRALGRTARWQAQIDWFQVHVREQKLSWVVFQGVVFLGYAAE